MKKNLLFILLLFCVFLTGCRSRYIPPPQESYINIRDSVVLRDSVVIRNETNKIDSVFIKDSTVLVMDTAGNIIRTELYRYKEVNRQLTEKNESLKAEISRLEALKQQVEYVPYPVEKELSLWQKIKLSIGEILIVIVLVMIGNLVVRVCKKVKGS